MHGDEIVAILIAISFFAMLFGIVYIRSRENMAMIEKGLNPRTKDTRPRPFINLKWGLLLLGCGFGLLCAYMIDCGMSKNDHSTGSYVTIGGHHSKKHKHVVVVVDSSRIAKDSTATKDTTAAADDNDDEGDDEDSHNIAEFRSGDTERPAIYFALIAIGGGLGLVLSYAVEKKHWLDKIKDN